MEMATSVPMGVLPEKIVWECAASRFPGNFLYPVYDLTEK